jgi:hypothetical protein
VTERDQLLAQLYIVVNFAVEGDNGVAIIGFQGLVAAFEIDDPKADGPY